MQNVVQREKMTKINIVSYQFVHSPLAMASLLRSLPFLSSRSFLFSFSSFYDRGASVSSPPLPHLHLLCYQNNKQNIKHACFKQQSKHNKLSKRIKKSIITNILINASIAVTLSQEKTSRNHRFIRKVVSLIVWPSGNGNAHINKFTIQSTLSPVSTQISDHLPPWFWHHTTHVSQTQQYIQLQDQWSKSAPASTALWSTASLTLHYLAVCRLKLECRTSLKTLQQLLLDTSL